MGEQTVEITCPRCRYAWYVDLATIDTPDQTIYRGEEPRRKTYRLHCPRCGTRCVVEVEEVDDG